MIKCKKIIGSILFAAIVTLCGCGEETQKNEYYSNGHNILAKQEITPVSMTSYTKSAFDLYVEENCIRAPLEPTEGCYIGSYAHEVDINILDDATGKKHAISALTMKLGEEFPHDWVLNCTANMKTPYIIIRPPNSYNYFQEDKLAEAARDFGSLPVPMFVDFYPNPRSYTDNSAAYVEFYRKARAIFAEEAPNVFFVASVDSRNVYDYGIFYPGDEYADWVGIIMYQPLYTQGSVNLRNYSKDLEFFCASFQKEKPIIVSQLAFSFYSTIDHRYASKEAAVKLSDFYGTLKDICPRIKGVNYMDIDELSGAPKNAERDNYSITQEKTLLNEYGNSISDSYFLSETVDSVKLKSDSEIYRSYFTVYEDENFKYVAKSALELEGVPLAENVMLINGEEYYRFDELAKLPGVTTDINEEEKKIIIHMN